MTYEYLSAGSAETPAPVIPEIQERDQWPAPGTPAFETAVLEFVQRGTTALEDGDRSGAQLALASLAAQAIRASRETVVRTAAEERTQRMALTNNLTGLPNRNVLRARQYSPVTRVKEGATYLYERAEDREIAPPWGWAAGYVDLDHFKTVNDTLGHSVGDRMLMLASNVLARTVRRNDEVYHLGGDEFALIMPLSQPFKADEFATFAQGRFMNSIREIRRDEADHLIPIGMELTIHDRLGLEILGATFGVAISEGSDVDRIALLERAEIAMRAAKPDNSR